MRAFGVGSTTNSLPPVIPQYRCSEGVICSFGWVNVAPGWVEDETLILQLPVPIDRVAAADDVEVVFIGEPRHQLDEADL